MSIELDSRLVETGTRFKIFPQPRYLSAFSEPEIIYVSVAPSQIQPGPADDRMYVIDPPNKRPYQLHQYPPFRGETNSPVKAGPDGHFDYIAPDRREFCCTTMYATVRRVLDIWEDYAGARIEWIFAQDFERLELIPLVDWNNAHSGYGFLEFGYGRSGSSTNDCSRPYCQNFDVLAHELGHNLLYRLLDFPDRETFAFNAAHEAGADLTAVISTLHFTKVVDHLLFETKGNLFTVNELERIGELSNDRQIRNAFNYYKMPDVADTNDYYLYALPLLGAVFDILVEIFQKKLVSKALISQQLADLSNHSYLDPTASEDDDKIQRQFAISYDKNPDGFKRSLLEARDHVGYVLTKTWMKLKPPKDLTYSKILAAMLEVENEINSGENAQTIKDCFAWREILIFDHPRLAIPRIVSGIVRY